MLFATLWPYIAKQYPFEATLDKLEICKRASGIKFALRDPLAIDS